MDRLYKRKLADAVSPHTSGNSARPPMDQCNYERNTSGLSFLCDYAPLCCKYTLSAKRDGCYFPESCGIGELVVIVRHIEAEPVVVQFWAEIHPRIANVSHELYADGHYSTAAEKAVKEVESRLREKFLELKTGAAVPAKIGDVIGALMSENGAFKFCDTTTASGRDYRRGIQSLFEGIMAAYRNPAAHANLQYEKREAMEQIMLASQLMYVLEKPQL